MSNPLAPPPSGPTFEWSQFKDWLYKLWRSITSLTFGSDPNSYSAVVMGSSAPGDGQPAQSQGSFGSYDQGYSNMLMGLSSPGEGVLSNVGGVYISPPIVYQSGSTTATTSTAYGTLFVGNVTITYPLAYPAGYVPLVTANTDTANGGIAVMANSITNTGFAATAVGLNNGATVAVRWQSR